MKVQASILKVVLEEAGNELEKCIQRDIDNSIVDN